MIRFTWLFLMAISSRLIAGGPEFEFDKVHIDNVVISGSGTALTVTVTGTIKLFVKVPSDESTREGDAKWVTLSCNGTPIEISGFGIEKAASEAGLISLRKRVMDTKGKDLETLQGWESRIEIKDGSVSRITANTVGKYALNNDEMAFKVELLHSK